VDKQSEKQAAIEISQQVGLMKCLLLTVLVSVSFFGSHASAQSALSITGRVLASEGNFPIANARVMARAVGMSGSTSTQMATTNEEGDFQLTNLRRANYAIRIVTAGYIVESSTTPATFYRPGENVTFRMIKGGVITGRVLNTHGEPMTLARVRVVRVKDSEGHIVRDSNATRDWITDDRGNYRIYGLEPGAYTVSAGPANTFRSATTSAQNSDTFTYFPSATLDGATLVNVYAGDETRGIEIRYRIQSSYLVAGTVAGDARTNETSASRAVISVMLSHVATSVAVASTSVMPVGAKTAFSFNGVSDGVYELTALTGLGTSDAAVSPPQRVTVSGANVTDVVLTLTPLSSVMGRVMLETTATADACREASVPLPDEVLITARRDKDKTALSSSPVVAQPDTHGEFSLTSMTAGRYTLDVRPPNRLWYVHNITWTTQPKTPLNSLTLKQGEHLQGLTITLARGAASVSGRVAAESAESLHVYVVPAQRENDVEALGYRESQVKADGTFSVAHLAPGRYWLLARAPAEGDTAKTLKRAAEKANLAVELQPCQQLSNYVLKFTP
jgi:hypothetical protein